VVGSETFCRFWHDQSLALSWYYHAAGCTPAVHADECFVAPVGVSVKLQKFAVFLSDVYQSPASCAEGAKGLGVFAPFPQFSPIFPLCTKIPQVPSFQAHSPVKFIFRQNSKNARNSQNTPSTKPYQNETQFPLSSLKSGISRYPRQPKSVICPPVISVTKFRHGTSGLSNVG
jgi:hypothetical protein